MFRPLPARLALACVLGALLAAPTAFAGDIPSYKLVVKNHKFQPQKLAVPTGQQFKLVVENQDATPMEFESYELDREKVIVGDSTVTIYLGPLDTGAYKFFDDFHRSTTTGVIEAKPQK
ncbi:MAG TPA: cupredoxin domain-containing protein [Gammaproteobacteria bacterium]|nr:cupredoxin domain-containing protein [Gammaproteobacteria bacterium]